MTDAVLASFLDTKWWPVTRNLLLFLAVVFWLAVGYWAFKDARRRIADPWLVALATLLGLVPPYVGALIYMLFRPPEYLEEVRERELEMKAMEARLQPRDLACPVCRTNVDATFLVCPVCTTRLREACASCRAPLDALWQVCPFCETQIAPRTIDLTQELESPALPPSSRRAGLSE